MTTRRAASPRVLIVDDSEGVRSYLASLPRAAGLRGGHRPTAQRSRAARSGAEPDVVLLDVMMPGEGGLETLRRIRERCPELPVVMISVIGKATTIVEAMQLGAADYLNKPFEEVDLVRALARARGAGEAAEAAPGPSALEARSGAVRPCCACAACSSRSRAPT